MTRYRLVWTETVEAEIDVESESAARQAWIDGLDGVPTDNRQGYDLVIEEVE